MGRMIDADALKELFPDDGEGSWTYNVTVKAYIDAQPTIEPERKTGHKINQHQYPAKWVCSECGARHFDFSDNFCSKCGTYVRGEQYESD